MPSKNFKGWILLDITGTSDGYRASLRLVLVV